MIILDYTWLYMIIHDYTWLYMIIQSMYRSYKVINRQSSPAKNHAHVTLSRRWQKWGLSPWPSGWPLRGKTIGGKLLELPSGKAIEKAIENLVAHYPRIVQVGEATLGISMGFLWGQVVHLKISGVNCPPPKRWTWVVHHPEWSVEMVDLPIGHGDFPLRKL